MCGCAVSGQGPMCVMDKKVVLVDGPHSCRSQLCSSSLSSTSSLSMTCKNSKIPLLQKLLLFIFAVHCYASNLVHVVSTGYLTAV